MTFRFGFLGGVPSPAIITNYEIGTPAVNGINGAGGNGYEALGQTFQIQSNKTITKIQVYLNKIGTPTANFGARIETTSGGLPTGTLVNANAVKEILGTSLPVSAGWVDFVFPAAFSLLSGVTYGIKIYQSVDDVTNSGQWTFDNGGASSYAYGQFMSELNGTWTADATRDFWFRVWGY